ncbi:MAG TPA: hypothetical protein ENG98_01405 [Actinobacteria bacterium]|nr:hypothetical protein [Actinomycetota bacterium]
MERSKLAPQESHWRDLFDRFDEKAAVEKLDTRIGQQRRAITLAGRVLIIRNMPGFSDFQAALRDIRDYVVSQLVSPGAENDVMRQLQGQCQAYDNILAVMEKGDVRVKALEEGLQELQNQRATIVRPKTNQEAAR